MFKINKNRKFAVIVAVFLLLTAFLFCFYESYELNHDCNHENECSICQILQICKNIKDGTQALKTVAIIVFAFIYLFRNIKSFSKYLIENTLIGLKVRLND